MDKFAVKPDPKNPVLTRTVRVIDHDKQSRDIAVPMERAVTLYLNAQEVVTMMTVGDYLDYLAVGFLRNQNMLHDDDEITGIDIDEEVDVVVVRTARETDYEAKLKKKVRTSGCAQGTVFGDVMDQFENARLAEDAVLHTSWMYTLARQINNQPSLYLEAGAVHGCVLCDEDTPLIYMEDVGRHNAMDKIAGYLFMNNMTARDKILYTTGRLTSEMVIKTVQMEIPILMSRSGFTAYGVELAQQAGLTLVGRAKGKRFYCASGERRIVYDADPEAVPPEPKTVQRKASLSDEE